MINNIHFKYCIVAGDTQARAFYNQYIFFFSFFFS